MTAAVFLFVLQILIVFRNIVSNKYMNFFWFCDFAPTLLAVAFLLKEEQLIKAIINIGLAAQLIVSILLIIGFTFHIDIIGTAKSLSYGKFYVTIELMIHLFPINFAFLLTRKKRPELRSLIYSFFVLAIMFILSRAFTDSESNINYVFALFGMSFPIYLFFPIWIMMLFLILSLPNYLLQHYFTDGHFDKKTLQKEYNYVRNKVSFILR